MEIRPLRQLKSQDLKDLFAQEREEWARQLHWDYREPQRVISAMIDVGSLPGFVALERSVPVAYAFYVEEAGKGLLGGCFASSDGEGQGAEQRLLDQALAALLSKPAIGRIESQFINFRQWPIAEFFARHDFSRFDRCFMLRDCHLEQRPRLLVDAGLRQWTLGDLDEAAQLTVSAYASVIDRQVTYHYQSLAECREFLSNLVFRPGCGTFLSDASYSARDRKTDELVGYVLASRISPQDGHIPQITVAAGHQGKGLGAGLLGRAIRYLGLNGYQSVSLTVTESNSAAMALYQRFGFSVHFRFPAFVWLRSSCQASSHQNTCA
ncbi:MAG: GNAT family N-acetyltransferase [Acidobacteria bacterium]|nr:GNAT family N-acetyltransferase [Acidobacteriota bacterium]MCI0717557.1 GNAT family N-acetyltransferase [Acidobacteriota bacterium]